MSKDRIYKEVSDRIDQIDWIIFYTKEMLVKDDVNSTECILEEMNIIRSKLMVAACYAREDQYGGRLEDIIRHINDARILISRYSGEDAADLLQIEYNEENIVVVGLAERSQEQDSPADVVVSESGGILSTLASIFCCFCIYAAQVNPMNCFMSGERSNFHDDNHDDIT